MRLLLILFVFLSPHWVRAEEPITVAILDIEASTQDGQDYAGDSELRAWLEERCAQQFEMEAELLGR